MEPGFQRVLGQVQNVRRLRHGVTFHVVQNHRQTIFFLKGREQFIHIGQSVGGRFPFGQVVYGRFPLAAAQDQVAFVDKDSRQPCFQRGGVAQLVPLAQGFFDGALNGVLSVAQLGQEGGGDAVERILHGHNAPDKFRLCHIVPPGWNG